MVLLPYKISGQYIYIRYEVQWLVCANRVDVNLVMTAWQLKHAIQRWCQ
jgi:hypothetical protein